eukprot:m.300566 g.300566  ORF g.300566 m.300566 type:complete len:322 (+) comp55212_c2_seq3:427-1392(+)
MGACASLCSLFCCPYSALCPPFHLSLRFPHLIANRPVPSRIVAKLAFLPPPCLYRLVDEAAGTGLVMEYQEAFGEPDVFYAFKPKEASAVHVSRVRTRRGNTVVSIFIEIPGATYTVLFSHGNAIDLAATGPECVPLAQSLKCNFMIYDYSGYGHSTGHPREANIYADIRAVWDFLQSRFGVPADRVILYGQSIGTAATIDLASRVQAAGVVLHSPIASGIRVVFPNTKINWCCDPFPGLKKMKRVACPVFFLHGEKDDVIPISHSRMLLDHTKTSVEPLFTRGDHDDIERHPQFIPRLKEFVAGISSANKRQSRIELFEV